MNDNMRSVEIARRMAELGQTEEACGAYELTISACTEKDAELELEAAMYILQSGFNYRIPYTSFCKLYNRGDYKDLCLGILTEAFYDPNKAEQKERYKENCALLAEYPHLARYDFIPFDELPIRFYPFDDNGYIPFFVNEGSFGKYTDFNGKIEVNDHRYDEKKAVVVSDLYSMRGLEYLNESINPQSDEWVDSFVYLHFSDWGTFCSHLQVLDFSDVLKSKKFVFMIEGSTKAVPQ